MDLHFPWLELLLLIPLVGAVWVRFLRDPEIAQRYGVFFSALTLLFAVGAWLDFATLHVFDAHDGFDIVSRFLGADVLVIDELTAPLLPLSALLYLITALATLRTKVRRFSFATTLLSEAILLALLSCRAPWAVIGLLAAHTVPPWLELRARRRPTLAYALHMVLFAGLMIAGQLLVERVGGGPSHSMWGCGLLIAAVLVRSGIVPVHCWMTHLFENATFGTALLFVTPMAGAYAAIRLVLPIAPDWALRGIAVISLVTAVYASGMALVQREARRFFCYLFLSHSALVLVGLEFVTPIGLTGSLCLWISAGLSLGGFGLTLRAMEAREGRLSLDGYHGLYEHTPTLAAFFLLTGLASVGFPGTIGFVATELLVEGAVQAYPLVGLSVVLAAALNGIAVLQAYFRIFGGPRHSTTVSLRSRWPEYTAVLVLTGLILGGGLVPQPGVASRYHAATEVLKHRDEQVVRSGLKQEETQ